MFAPQFEMQYCLEGSVVKPRSYLISHLHHARKALGFHLTNFQL